MGQQARQTMFALRLAYSQKQREAPVTEAPLPMMMQYWESDPGAASPVCRQSWNEIAHIPQALTEF